MTEKIKEHKDKLTRLLKLTVIVVVGLWVIIPSISFFYFGKPGNAGEFGDTFGIINALFSSLAFALLIYTSLMQKEELELQRKELKLTRRELKLTRTEIEKSAIAQNTLVELTREELEMQKNIRRSQVKPELKFQGVRWVTIFDDAHHFEIKLSVKYHRLKIDSVKITTEVGDFKVDEEHLKTIKGKYFEDLEDFTVILDTDSKSQDHPEGLKVSIQFHDVDSFTYRQQILFENYKQVISNVQEVDLVREMFS